MEFLQVLQHVVPLGIPAVVVAIFAVPLLMGITWVLPAYLGIRKH